MATCGEGRFFERKVVTTSLCRVVVSGLFAPSDLLRFAPTSREYQDALEHSILGALLLKTNRYVRL